MYLIYDISVYFLWGRIPRAQRPPTQLQVTLVIRFISREMKREEASEVPLLRDTCRHQREELRELQKLKHEVPELRRQPLSIEVPSFFQIEHFLCLCLFFFLVSMVFQQKMARALLTAPKVEPNLHPYIDPRCAGFFCRGLKRRKQHRRNCRRSCAKRRKPRRKLQRRCSLRFPFKLE